MKNQRDRLNYRKQTEDRCCENPCIDIRRGNNVCLNCGLVFEVQLIESERRAYSNEEIEKRKQTEPRWRDFGSRTILSTSRVDYKGNYLNAEKKTLFSRLSKIQNSLISGAERNFWEAKPKMKQIVSKLNVPEYIHEIAWKIYTLAVKKRLTVGRSIDGFITASIYVAIRMHEFPKVLEEVSDAAMIDRKVVIHALGMLIREILPELNITYKPISAKQLIFKFGNELGLSMEIQKNALKLLSNSSKKGLNSTGKDPKGLAASAIYLSAKSLGERKTQSEIAETAKITEVTLRTRIKEIRDKIDLTQ